MFTTKQTRFMQSDTSSIYFISIGYLTCTLARSVQAELCGSHWISKSL